jgi:hypothetical protein
MHQCCCSGGTLQAELDLFTACAGLLSVYFTFKAVGFRSSPADVDNANTEALVSLDKADACM